MGSDPIYAGWCRRRVKEAYNRRMRKLLLALVVATPLFAQRLAESVQVTIIEVPVTVSDRSGNSVRGLATENFELYVDGQRVPVEYFESVDLSRLSDSHAEATAQMAPRPIPAAAYRNFLLLFDIAHSEPGVTARAQAAARQFLETELRGRDLVAVATYTAERGTHMITSFTRDRQLLLEAIRTLGDARYFKVMDPLLLSARLNPHEGDPVEPNEAAAIERMRDLDVQTTRLNDAQIRDRVRTQLLNFGEIAHVLDRMRGQKQIILLSPGFDARMITGRTDLGSAAARAENTAAERGEYWNIDSDARFGNSTATS